MKMKKIHLIGVFLLVSNFGYSDTYVSQSQGYREVSGYPATTTTAEGSKNRADARDPIPTPPQLVTPVESVGLRQQAGVGGEIAYTSAGVLELGGFLSATRAKNYSEVGIAPFVGYFFADNLQISGLASWNYVKTKNPNNSTSITSALLEPSVHMPINNSNFVFAGVGLGGIFPRGRDHSFAVAPRVGYKNLVGRSGILTVALQAMYGLSQDSELQSASGTVLSVETVSQLTVGYTVVL